MQGIVNCCFFINIKKCPTDKFSENTHNCWISKNLFRWLVNYIDKGTKICYWSNPSTNLCPVICCPIESFCLTKVFLVNSCIGYCLWEKTYEVKEVKAPNPSCNTNYSKSFLFFVPRIFFWKLTILDAWNARFCSFSAWTFSPDYSNRNSYDTSFLFYVLLKRSKFFRSCIC